jgi:hypothetical protein
MGGRGVAHGGNAEFGAVGPVAVEWRVGAELGDRITLADVAVAVGRAQMAVLAG